MKNTNTNEENKMRELNYRYVNCTTASKDWGYGESWDIVYPDTGNLTEAQLIEKLITYGEPESELKNLDEDALRELLEERLMMDDSFFPVMNYYIDLEEDVEDAQEIATKLWGSVFTVIILESSLVVALTGGGMDMTWDIVRAFMLLDSVPPVQYAELPAMAGEHDNDVIEACNQALRAVIDRHTRSIERNSDLRSGN